MARIFSSSRDANRLRSIFPRSTENLSRSRTADALGSDAPARLAGNSRLQCLATWLSRRGMAEDRGGGGAA